MSLEVIGCMHNGSERSKLMISWCNLNAGRWRHGKFTCKLCFFVFQGSKCANKNSRLFRLFLRESYQQTLRVVEYLFLSFGCAFVCHFCFALSLFCHFLSFSHPARVAGPGADLESRKTSFCQHMSHFLAFFVHCFWMFLHFLAFPRWGHLFGIFFCTSQTKVTKKWQ